MCQEFLRREVLQVEAQQVCVRLKGSVDVYTFALNHQVCVALDVREHASLADEDVDVLDRLRVDFRAHV